MSMNRLFCLARKQTSSVASFPRPCLILEADIRAETWVQFKRVKLIQTHRRPERTRAKPAHAKTLPAYRPNDSSTRVLNPVRVATE